MEPAEEGGAEVVADPRVVVHDADDFVLLVGDAGGAVGGVTLGGDAVVPVVVGGGGVLDFYGFEPGVLAGGLVEVAVDADEAGGFGGCLRLGGLRGARFGHKYLVREYRGWWGWVCGGVGIWGISGARSSKVMDEQMENQRTVDG